MIKNAIERAERQWNEKVPPLQDEHNALSEKFNEASDTITALRNLEAGYNPLRWLVNVWKRATQIPKLKRLADHSRSRQEEIVATISEEAQQTASQLCGLYVAEKPELKRQREDLLAREQEHSAALQKYQEGLQSSQDLLRAITSAAHACRDAESAERRKAWASHKQKQWAARRARQAGREAGSALRGLQDTLAEYGHYMEERFGKKAELDISGNEIDRIITTYNGGLFENLFDEFTSSFSLFGRAARYREAQEQLATLEHSVSRLTSQIEDLGTQEQDKLKEVKAALTIFRQDTLNKLAEEVPHPFVQNVKTHMTLPVPLKRQTGNTPGPLSGPSRWS